MSDPKGTGDRAPERGAASARREAARTTIVGGQPPGSPRELPPIPVGLEQLLGLAAVSPDFAAALRRDRATAVEAAGVEITASEQAILAAVPAPALEQMIAQLDGRLAEPERRAFFEHAALALATLVGGTALAGCGDKKRPAEGTGGTAAPPRPRPDEHDYEVGSMGVRPDRDPTPAPDMSATLAPPDAVRPSARDEPGMDADAMDLAAPPDAGVARPRPRPMRPKPTRGIRPREDDPGRHTRGHSAGRAIDLGGGSRGGGSSSDLL